MNMNQWITLCLQVFLVPPSATTGLIGTTCPSINQTTSVSSPPNAPLPHLPPAPTTSPQASYPRRTDCLTIRSSGSTKPSPCSRAACPGHRGDRTVARYHSGKTPATAKDLSDVLSSVEDYHHHHPKKSQHRRFNFSSNSPEASSSFHWILPAMLRFLNQIDPCQKAGSDSF